LGDLDLPLYLYLPLEDSYIFLSYECPLSNNASVFFSSMFSRLIYSDNKDDTTSSKFKEVVLQPMATTRISHEFDKEHSKLIHLSSSEILISIDTN
jgi:hypothetical protein